MEPWRRSSDLSRMKHLALLVFTSCLIANIVLATETVYQASDACQKPDEYMVLLSDLSLSTEEQELLNSFCLSSDVITAVRASNQSLSTAHDCIPDGVDCEATSWCDQGGVCSTVCQRGSVVVDPWLQYALKFQRALSRQQPLCAAQLLGTHNSGITIADGYGNRDAVFQRYLAFISWAGGRTLRTNNQWLSLTDQMNLGVRVIELDTHWVKRALRVAHCGGLHLKRLDELIKALNLLARIFHHPIQWDSETVGCRPCLSSITAEEQRTLVDAFDEISKWMNADGNEDEFLVLFFDDQQDLKQWGKLQDLLDAVTSVFDLDIIITPNEWSTLMQGVWPSIDTLLAMGKRLLLVSGRDYGEAVQSLIFPRSHMGCGWHEPQPAMFQGPPVCAFQGQPEPADATANNSGRIVRTSSCELMYGPLNCDFSPAPQRMLLDTTTLPDMARCGVNMPSPDGFTPDRAAAQVWSWAPGHPFWSPTASCSEAAGSEAARCLHPADTGVSNADGSGISTTAASSVSNADGSGISNASATSVSNADGSGISTTAAASVSNVDGSGVSTAAANTGISNNAISYTGSRAPARKLLQGDNVKTTSSGDDSKKEMEEGAGEGNGREERGQEACVVTSADDGHWRVVSCAESFPSACRLNPGDASSGNPLWLLSYPPTPYASCPPSYSFTFPQTPQDNLALQQLMQSAGEGAVFVALRGPDFIAPETGKL